MNKKKLYSGQALLIVLLSMAVVLVVVLSILARSITDVSISSQDENSLRAFSAAEAGVEKALISGSMGIFTGMAGDTQYEGNVISFAEGISEFTYPIPIGSGDSATVWFVAHDDEGNFVCSAEKPCFKGCQIKVCWGNSETDSNSATAPALEASIFYAETPGDYTTLKIARVAIDPNSSRSGTNNFSAPDAGSCQIGSNTFAFQKNLDLTNFGIPSSSCNTENGLQIAKLKFFYNTDIFHQIGVSSVDPNKLFPAQGIKIESTGVSAGSNRKVEVFQSYAESPLIFDSAIFSPGGIIK